MNRFRVLCLVSLLACLSLPAQAQWRSGVQFTAASPESVEMLFHTQLLSLSLTGGPYPIPLASDPGNLLGDSVSGYGFVNSLVLITLSSERGIPGPPSLGQACASRTQGATGLPSCTTQDPVDPNVLNGKTFYVDSFFDVFFDITVTDVDNRPGRDFAGQPHGASIVLTDNGPAHMQSLYSRVFDKNVPNYGIVPPPQVSPYIGHFQIEIPLGGDVNGNGENDKVKFTLAAHAVGDQNRTFVVLPNGTVLDNFDSAAFMAGSVVDMSTDPPFSLGSEVDGHPVFGDFGGPTEASSLLASALSPTPVEPSNWGRIKSLLDR